MTVMVLGLLVVSVLGGCSSNPPKPTEPERSPAEEFAAKVDRAYALLKAGYPEAAATMADDADAIVRGLSVDRTACDLVKAEIALTQGNLDEAACIADAVRKGDAWNAPASEILGNVALRRGHLDQAAAIFREARQHARHEASRDRLADLVALVAGLEAYGRSDLEVARRYWSSIRDSDIRYAVDVAVRNVANR
jgi:ATP/maltotriose-dependent transcriptional regulator MalT